MHSVSHFCTIIMFQRQEMPVFFLKSFALLNFLLAALCILRMPSVSQGACQQCGSVSSVMCLNETYFMPCFANVSPNVQQCAPGLSVGLSLDLSEVPKTHGVRIIVCFLCLSQEPFATIMRLFAKRPQTVRLPIVRPNKLPQIAAAFVAVLAYRLRV